MTKIAAWRAKASCAALIFAGSAQIAGSALVFTSASNPPGCLQANFYALQSQGTTVADLYQARLAIEPSAVRWLATGRGTGSIVKLRDIVAELSRLIDEERYDEFIDSLQVFHHALVEGSGSKTVTFMNYMLINLAGQHQRDYNRRHPQVREIRSKEWHAAIRSYEKLINLIEAGSVEQAVAHWRLHLRNANTAWAGAGKGERLVDSLGTK